MKNKFKVGQKMKLHSPCMDATVGKTYTISEVTEKLVGWKDDVSENCIGHHLVLNYFTILPEKKTLTIKKLTRKRKGDEYFTWQFSVNGKVSNHNFNSPQSRDKSLTRFIKYIQDGDFKIVK